MNKRQRKKARVGEFLELGIHLYAEMKEEFKLERYNMGVLGLYAFSISKELDEEVSKIEDFNIWCDSLLSFLESRNLVCGEGIGNKIELFITGRHSKKQSVTTEDIQKIYKWFIEQKRVHCIGISDLTNCWGTDEEFDRAEKQAQERAITDYNNRVMEEVSTALLTQHDGR